MLFFIIITVAAAVLALFVYLNDEPRRRVRRVLGRIDGRNPQWTFLGPVESSGTYISRFGWSATASVQTEDGLLSVVLKEEVETIRHGGTRRTAQVYVCMNGKELFNQEYLDIAAHRTTVLFISSRIGAVAGTGTPDPKARCDAFLARCAAETKCENEMRRKYT